MKKYAKPNPFQVDKTLMSLRRIQILVSVTSNRFKGKKGKSAV